MMLSRQKLCLYREGIGTFTTVINVYYYHTVTLPGFQVLYFQYSQLGAGMLKNKKTQKVSCNAHSIQNVGQKNRYELLCS